MTQTELAKEILLPRKNFVFTLHVLCILFVFILHTRHDVKWYSMHCSILEKGVVTILTQLYLLFLPSLF